MQIEITDIVDSVQCKGLIRDKELDPQCLKRSNKGLLRYAGGFSVVFPYEYNGQTKAIRFWHKNLSDIQSRYARIDEDLKKVNLPYFCDFEYIDQALVVNGTIIPATRMQWVEGRNIKDYICENKDDRSKLIQLAQKFSKMCCDLHSAHIAHGDLQHGNILVDKDDNLRLIDYDSLVTPSLKNMPDEIKGLSAYQHPKRSRNKYATEKLDYFSELIIYLSILAIANDAQLVQKYQVNAADRLLFAKSDFESVNNTGIWKDLSDMGGDILKLLNLLRDYLRKDDINKLKPVENAIFVPTISLFTDPKVLKKWKDNDVEISWSTTYLKDVVLSINGETFNVSSSGKKHIKIDDTVFCQLTAKSVYGDREISKNATINAFEESKTTFTAERNITFSDIPVRLSWNVENAKKVVLKGVGNVEMKGERDVSINKDTTFTLEVEDAFGISTYDCLIKTLPMPKVQTLNIPVVNINLTQQLDIKVSRPEIKVDVPEIAVARIGFDSLKLPPVHNMIEYRSPVSLRHIGGLFGKLYNRITTKING